MSGKKGRAGPGGVVKIEATAIARGWGYGGDDPLQLWLRDHQNDRLADQCAALHCGERQIRTWRHQYGIYMNMPLPPLVEKPPLRPPKQRVVLPPKERRRKSPPRPSRPPVEVRPPRLYAKRDLVHRLTATLLNPKTDEDVKPPLRAALVRALWRRRLRMVPCR